jgi:hypothetical protein
MSLVCPSGPTQARGVNLIRTIHERPYAVRYKLRGS